jgi:hypothetical protein
MKTKVTCLISWSVSTYNVLKPEAFRAAFGFSTPQLKLLLSEWLVDGSGSPRLSSIVDPGARVAAD